MMFDYLQDALDMMQKTQRKNNDKKFVWSLFRYTCGL